MLICFFHLIISDQSVQLFFLSAIHTDIPEESKRLSRHKRRRAEKHS